MVTFHEHDGRISDERKQRLSGVKYPTVYYDPSPPSTLLSSFSFVLSLLPRFTFSALRRLHIPLLARSRNSGGVACNALEVTNSRRRNNVIYVVQSWYAGDRAEQCIHAVSRERWGEGSGTERESRTYPGLIVAFTSAVQPEKRIERKRGGRGKNPRFPGSRLDSFGFAVMRKRSGGLRAAY